MLITQLTGIAWKENSLFGSRKFGVGVQLTGTWLGRQLSLLIHYHRSLTKGGATVSEVGIRGVVDTILIVRRRVGVVRDDGRSQPSFECAMKKALVEHQETGTVLCVRRVISGSSWW
ncbi:hypothetical protein GCK72_009085 [Caenorhabditis remanei]|uniref:Uncharacterized protein n=1 Tax=Caenorhabditis remanei TaxID=31234 RepID=A0A6A5H1N4_CAERE|nr:hypothetical protein GCK72_009085 [Caenorhabditis remanei]KAF1760835.1 hypothetical protein GCK72_009085 [Caenorhabditis remanei]